MSLNIACLPLKQRVPSYDDMSPLVTRKADDTPESNDATSQPYDVINNNDKSDNATAGFEISERELESLEDEILKNYLPDAGDDEQEHVTAQIASSGSSDPALSVNDTYVNEYSLNSYAQRSISSPGISNINDVTYIECDVSDIKLDESQKEASIDFFNPASQVARAHEADDAIPVPRPPPLSFAALRMNLSFAGCGFLGIYHLGVVHSLAHHGHKLLLNVQRFGGASAGSLVASALAVKGPDKEVIQECVDFCFNLAEGVRRRKMGVLTPRMSLLEPLENFLVKMFPEDAHLIARGRLFISVTDARRRKNYLQSDFESKEHLIKKFVDGGMTNNLPELPDGRTILVTPFSGRQDICPVDKSRKERFVRMQGEDFQVNAQNVKRGLHAFFPPKRKHLEKYFQRGKNDAIRFLKRENLYSDGVN